MRIDCAQKGIANPRFKASGLQIRWNGKTGYTIGIGTSIGMDIMPFNISGNINYGGTMIGNTILKKNNLYLKSKN